MRDPVRTCVGCGAKAAQRELVRLRVESGCVVIDRRRAGGRGAWVHSSAGCLEGAARRRAFARVFREPRATVDLPRLRAELTGDAGRY